MEATEFVQRFGGLAREAFATQHPYGFLVLERNTAVPMDDTGFRTVQGPDESGGTAPAAAPAPPPPPPPPPPPDLGVDGGDDPARDLVLPINKGTGTPFPSMITVGRAGNNDMVLKFQHVSKFHAYFTVDARTKRYSLVDAGSTNGTSVNRRPLGDGEKAELAEGDQINFGGDIVFTFFSNVGLHAYLPVLSRRLAREGASGGGAAPAAPSR